MSDRRTVVLFVAVLGALVGLVAAVVAALLLRDPVMRAGDLGEPVDLTGELIGALVVGLALLLSGAGTAAALVRAQLRRLRTPA